MKSVVLMTMIFLSFLVNLPFSGFNCTYTSSARAEPIQQKTDAFPKSFRFCVSTAAHQIEGNNIHSDWWEWEQLPGKIKNGHTSLVATDSWNHLDEDIANMKWLGISLYRFSIEWAKIEPEEGVFEETVLQQYITLIDKLHAAGIEPMVTLYHFTLPTWVAKKGGWEWDGIPRAFEKFTEFAVKKINTRVKLWITLNEPMSIITAGYISTIFPPGKNDMNSIGVPMTLMVKAHALSYHKIHKILDSETFKPEVGLAHHLRVFEPENRFSLLDHYAAHKIDYIFNWAIPDALKNGTLKFSMPFIAKLDEEIPEAINTQDFFGLNYYSRDLVSLHPFAKEKLTRAVAPGAEVQDLGWEIYPEGMGEILDEIHERYPSQKIWITENGIADQSDEKRANFIQQHLAVTQKALKSGIPIEGYCHWTLNDNFEWAEGYTAHFGLFSLEPKTLKRIPRASAKAFSDIIHQ